MLEERGEDPVDAEGGLDDAGRERVHRLLHLLSSTMTGLITLSGSNSHVNFWEFKKQYFLTNSNKHQ